MEHDGPHQFFNPQLMISLYGQSPDALSQDEIKKLKQGVQPWPPNAAANKYYVVSREEASFQYDYVLLPAGFVLYLADDVPGLNLQITTLEFGIGAVIDISAVPPPGPGDQQPSAPESGHGPMIRPPWPPPNTPDAPAKAAAHENGTPGYAGLPGHPGNPGRPLTMLVKNLVFQGSLWVRTNGGVGGPGGNGSAGGEGGNNACDGADKANGGNGGRGGNGGIGGTGGDTSIVTIQINNQPVGWSLKPIANTTYCGFAETPDNWTGFDDGRIIVWGSPGCGGTNGVYSPPGGLGGGGGAGGGASQGPLSCNPFPGSSYSAFPGNAGPAGTGGSDGPMGGAGSVILQGPPSSGRLRRKKRGKKVQILGKQARK
jgi:hypothetical protein